MSFDHHILILDGYNLIHRARSGFQKGDHPIPFNFFRGLRPLVAQFKPDEVYFVIEGIPKRNLELLPEYKGTRVEADDDFIRQKDEVIELLKSFPVRVVYHPDHEADDVIAHLCQVYSRGLIADKEKGLEYELDLTVVSTDTDFIQLLQQYENVKLWNWRKKSYTQPPDYDYVKWKALRGDGCDNIAGVPGVGDKTAEKWLKDGNLFEQKMQGEATRELYERNLKLIKFFEFSEAEKDGIIEFEEPTDMEHVKKTFESWGFRSMLKDSTWQKYTKTFEAL